MVSRTTAALDPTFFFLSAPCVTAGLVPWRVLISTIAIGRERTFQAKVVASSAIEGGAELRHITSAYVLKCAA
jgi:hypothetical protein